MMILGDLIPTFLDHLKYDSCEIFDIIPLEIIDNHRYYRLYL